jgi:ssDNA thymidine ADP-ribosyltransferase, DarT
VGYAMVQIGKDRALIGRHVKLGLWIRLPRQQKVEFLDSSISGPQVPKETFYDSSKQQDPTRQEIADVLSALARSHGINDLPDPSMWKIGNFESVESEVLARGIARVLHFTPLGNVPSIVKHGVVPRAELDDRQLPYICTDHERGARGVDLLRYSCLSIGWHNYKMLFAKSRGCFKGWAIIELQPSVLAKDCLFFECNSSTRGALSHYQNDPQGLRGVNALRRLYADAVDGCNRSADISSDMPTHPQAEVMCAEVLPWECVSRCVVSCEDDRQEIFKRTPSASHEAVKVDKELFRPRQDWRQWKTSAITGIYVEPMIEHNDFDIPF